MQQRRYPATFKIESSIMRIGHADAAMKLDHLVGHEAHQFARRRFRQRGEQWKFIGVMVERVDRREDAAAREFHFDKQFGSAMLQGLEASDRLPELSPRAHIVERHFKRAVARAEHFRSKADAGAVQRMFER